MKRFSSILIFIFLVIPAFSQKHVLRLSDKKMVKPARKFIVSEIVDVRLDKTNIGFLPGQTNRPGTLIQTEKPLLQELKAFFALNTDPLPEAVPVIMKINKIKITQKILGNNKIAYAEIAVEFLALKDGQYFKLLAAGSMEEAGSSSRKKLSNLLVRGLQDCVTQLSRIDINEKLRDAKALDPGYVNLNTYYTPETAGIPILKAYPYKKGAYRHFQEFKNNNPTIADVYQEGKHVVNLKGQKLKDIWGYSDGANTYMLFGPDKQLVRLEKKDGGFSFSTQVSSVNSDAVLAGALLGGLVGGAVAAAVTHETQTITMVLNMLTGMATDQRAYGPHADLNRMAKVVLYRTAKGEAAEKMDIYVKGNLFASLLPNSFQILNFNSPVNEIEFLVNGKDQGSLKFTPSLDQINYVACSQPKKKGAEPGLKQVSTKEATYYIKLIQLHQKK